VSVAAVRFGVFALGSSATSFRLLLLLWGLCLFLDRDLGYDLRARRRESDLREQRDAAGLAHVDLELELGRTELRRDDQERGMQSQRHEQRPDQGPLETEQACVRGVS